MSESDPAGMDAYEAYFAAQRELVELVIARDTCVNDLVFHAGAGLKVLNDLVASRHELYTTGELQRTGQDGYLVTGLFAHLGGTEREAAILAALELEDEVGLTRLRRSCEPYREDHPLLQQAPSLSPLIARSELIHVDGNVARLDGSMQLVQVGALRARLHHLLPPGLTRWLDSNVQVPLFLRLNPYEVGPDLRPNLMEAAIRPADPSWWQNLRVFPGQRKPSRYELLDCEPREDSARCWEYRVRNMGRLDVSFRRDHSGMLSGAIEELPRPGGPHPMIGYFLHLTSDNAVDDEWDAATATHIDGAINVYLDSDEDKPQQRWSAPADGKTMIPASFRTHLFRVDNVPLRFLIPIAERFFRSQLLLGEWLEDQFGA